jgi:uncharacterized membrane protein (DUF2068 family)
MSSARGTGVLVCIALFKLVKAVTLIALGIGALSLLQHSDAFETMRRFTRELGVDPNHRFVNRTIAKVSGLDHRRLEEVGAGTFVYAAVFLTEGTGLLLRKRWAEYLTIIVTASFIPFEIYEMVHKPSAPKAVGIVVNALIVGYLVLRLRRERKESEPQAARA